MQFIELNKSGDTHNVAGPMTVNIADVVKVAPDPDGIGTNVTIRGD